MAQRDIGQLRTRLSWEDDGNKQGLEGFRRDLKGLRSEMTLAKSGGKEYTNSLKGMQQQSDILSRRFKTQEERVKELRKRYDESVKVKGEDANATRDLQSQLNNATADMNRTEGQLQRLNDEIKRMESPWTKLGDGMTKTGETLQTVGRGMTDFGKDYTMKVTAPIVAGGIAMFKASMDYESAFAGVRKTVDMSEEGYAKLSKGIRDMAKELPASASEIAGVAEAAGQLGIENDSILSFTRTIIDLGESTNLSLEQASSEFARFANIVGMSQDDFDRLGSSVVGLGNTMATTESEIMSMAMRLAAQGSQVGMTEAQIVALSATMSSLGIEAEAGGTAMTTVLKKIDKAVGESGEGLEGFSKAAGVSSKDFAKAWEDDPITALDMFIKGLSESSDEGKNLTTILEDLGIKGIREADTILRMAGASDLLTDAVETSSSAWEENSALTDEAAQRYATTESQLKILWNRVKDMAITLGDALIPAVMDALDAAEPLIQKIEDGAQAFADMSEEEQQSILKMIALVAAIGPATIGLGHLVTGIGGVLKIGGGVASMLGKTGGAGLLGRIGLMGMGGPVGLAVGGVALLAGGIYALSEASKENIEETHNSIIARQDELDTLDKTIGRYEELQGKNKLTTDEVLRYMDIMDELKNAKSEEAIKKLSDEQATLLEKSGFTNEEMQEFLGLNDELVEKTPATVTAISDQGNAYADNLEIIKELSAEERKRLSVETYGEIIDKVDEYNDALLEQKDIEKEINNLKDERNEVSDQQIELGGQIKENNNEILGLEQELLTAGDDRKKGIEDRISQLEIENGNLLTQQGMNKEHIDDLDTTISKKQTSLGETNKQLTAYTDMISDYERMLMLEQGIVDEKGNAYDSIKDASSAIDQQITKLKQQHAAGELSTEEYDKQIGKLTEQQGKIEGLQGESQNLNAILREKIDKEVQAKLNPTADSINRLLGGTITKRVNLSVPISPITQAMRSLPNRAYAKGTDYHPGGLALVGEEGPELARQGNKWSMLDFGITDLPRGTQVFTHDESKKILSAMNRLPGYANGVSPSGETNRVISGLNSQQPVENADTVNLLTRIAVAIESGQSIQIEGREVMRATVKYFDEGLNNVGDRRQAAWGG